jgi:hypothetical protein
MKVEIGAEAAQFPEKEYINGIAFAVWYLPCLQTIRFGICLVFRLFVLWYLPCLQAVRFGICLVFRLFVLVSALPSDFSFCTAKTK